MNKFIITSESTCDLPYELIKEYNIKLINMSFRLDNVDYVDGDISPKTFYDKVRSGSMPTTYQVNPENAKEFFIPLLDKGLDILHIAFSSGLSGTYNSFVMAAKELKEIYPEREIEIVDSLCASLGEGLLVYYAVEKAKTGASLKETYEYIEELKLHLCLYFTVDNLHHLHRGGRVSKFSAIIGTMLGIKPVLHVNNEGRLIPISKIKGRKKALINLVEKMEEKLTNERKNEIVFISHGDSEEDALFVKKLIEDKFGIKKFVISNIGAVIGTHSGEQTIALFFVGKER